jgi:hypothetical protein
MSDVEAAPFSHYWTHALQQTARTFNRSSRRRAIRQYSLPLSSSSSRQPRRPPTNGRPCVSPRQSRLVLPPRASAWVGFLGFSRGFVQDKFKDTNDINGFRRTAPPWDRPEGSSLTVASTMAGWACTGDRARMATLVIDRREIAERRWQAHAAIEITDVLGFVLPGCPTMRCFKPACTRLPGQRLGAPACGVTGPSFHIGRAPVIAWPPATELLQACRRLAASNSDYS